MPLESVERIGPGGLLTLEVAVRDGAGALVAPDGGVITAEVSDPAAAVVADAVDLQNDGVGLYRLVWHSPAAADLGLWTATVSATIAGVPVALALPFRVVADAELGAVGPLGASLDGVRALLPGQPFDSTTRTTSAGVDRFLRAAIARVNLRFDALEVNDPDRATALRPWAAQLAETAAAAWADAAARPETADPNDASSYAEWLWRRFTEGLEELAALVDVDGDGDIDEPPPASGAAGSPAHSFPSPAFSRDTGF